MTFHIYGVLKMQEPVVREAKARLQEKYRAAQQLGEEVSTIQKRK